MLKSPTQVHLNNEFQATQPNPKQNSQHGRHHFISILLDVASETLTHITSFLDPPSLLALSRVNRTLYEHVKDDNTWHRAFIYQLLRIGPESDLQNEQSLILRRTESSWRKEFIIRYNLRRRWERSQNPTTTHTPHHAVISSMHLMPGHSLLTSAIQYGVVSRSIPLTGKILPGFLDASGTGLGIGNPNAEFSPNVSACALSSDGGTAKIAWGFRNGEIAVTTAGKAMEGGARAASKFKRCKVQDEHTGAVLDVIWDKDKTGDGDKIISGGADGRVKIWDAKTVQCLWTSEKKPGSLVPDPCLKVAAALASGVVVSAMKSGEIVVWTKDQCQPTVVHPHYLEIRVPAPIRMTRDDASNTPHRISAFHLDVTSTSPTLLAAYEDHPHFYRLRVNLGSNTVEQTAFGDPSFGSITSLKPVFTTRDDESSFVIVGDQLGCVSVYDWSSPVPPISVNTDASKPDIPSVMALRKFEAHDDGAVTAVAWNSVTLLTGSSCGSIKVFDSVTFAPLKSFPSAPPRQRTRGEEQDGEQERVTQILVGEEREVMVASVGSRVVAWRASAVRRGNEKGGVRGRNSNSVKKGRSAVQSKWQQYLKLHQTITESLQDIEQEQKYKRRADGREREQRARLERLGLDEVEAVEYMLMVSRDEEEMRIRNSPPQAPAEEGVFEDDFDEIPTTFHVAQTSPPLSPSASFSSRRSSNSSAYHSQSQPSRSTPRISPSTSNNKVQVSPRFLAEPTEAASGTGTSPLSLNLGTSITVASTNTAHYPPISTGKSPSPSPESVVSPKSASAWSKPLKSMIPSVNPQAVNVNRSTWVPRSNAISYSSSHPEVAAPEPSPLARHANIGADQTTKPAENDDDVDEDLRLAIELSLIEARRRGENI